MTFDSISDTIDRALTSAGLNPRSGAMKTVSDTIRQSLENAGLAQGPAGSPDDAGLPEAPGQAGKTAGGAGEFVTCQYRGAAGSRAYKLYTPASVASTAGAPRALVVMLHGCKQDPDDFAIGTRMNVLADTHGFLVAYPAQSSNANGSNCWNWFQAGDQHRDRGEPAIIAGIVREIAAGHDIDAGRVFVAGLSAGAAMAVILGAAYPDVFKAVGAHSGLPVGAAHDVASAFAAMHGGGSGDAPGKSGVPTIVFQGDHDTTVVAANADAIVRQALGRQTSTELTQTVAAGAGRLGYSTTSYVDSTGRSQVEKWVVAGGAHTWFGGNPRGSYTEARGPDASAEMVRFFLQR